MNARRLPHGLLLLIGLLFAPASVAQDLRDGFFTQVSGGRVFAMAIEADGRVLIAGEFRTVNGLPCPSICRLNADGTLANSFPFFDADTPVYALAVQPDGRIVYAVTAYGGPSLDHYVSRLFSDGRFDPSLDLRLGSPAHALAIEDSGNILVGGDAGLVEGVTTTALIRLRQNGTIDSAFTPRFGTAGARVRAIALRDDGAIYIGGSFGAINSDSRLNLALFAVDGSLDDSLDRAVNGPVNALAVQADGSLVIGGAFTEVINSARANLARLRPDTTLDTGFAPSFNGEVLTVEALADGSLGVGGRFSLVGTTQRKGLARLRRDGALLPSANIDALATGAVVQVLHEQPDRRLLFAGQFTVGGLQQNQNLARVDTDGRLDSSLSAPASSSTTAVLQQPDGRLLVARRDGCSSTARACLRRLFSDGSVDSSFTAPAFNAGITGLALLPDGDVLVQGEFSQIDGIARPNLIRLNADGSLDTGFDVPAQLRTVDFVRFADGRLAVSGVFGPPGGLAQQSLNWLLPNGSVDLTPAQSVLGLHNAGVIAMDGEQRVLLAMQPRSSAVQHLLLRFHIDGQVDDSFTVEADGAIRAVHPLPDGSLLIGGSFAQVKSTPAPVLARLRSDGSLDPGFSAALALPSAPGSPPALGVNALAVRRDGRIAVGLTADAITSTQSSLRLLEPNGAAIGVIAPSLLGVVDTLSLQNDGRLLFGGRFTTQFGATRTGLARLALPGAGGSRLTVDGDTALLRHGPAAPELVAAPRLSIALDGGPFIFDQPFERSADGWRLDALALPRGISYALRIRETVGQGVAGSAQGLSQADFIQAPDPRLFGNGFESSAP